MNQVIDIADFVGALPWTADIPVRIEAPPKTEGSGQESPGFNEPHGPTSQISDARPHVPRRGCLRHGNPSGNPDSAPRCGAHTRAGGTCRQPAMHGKARCRLHGGKSTGPRTVAGRERTRRACLRHGFRSRAWCDARKGLTAWCRAASTASSLWNAEMRLVEQRDSGRMCPLALLGLPGIMELVTSRLTFIADSLATAIAPIEELLASEIPDTRPHAPRGATVQTVVQSGPRASRPLMGGARGAAAGGTPALRLGQRAFAKIPDARPHAPREMIPAASGAGTAGIPARIGEHLDPKKEEDAGKDASGPGNLEIRTSQPMQSGKLLPGTARIPARIGAIRRAERCGQGCPRSREDRTSRIPDIRPHVPRSAWAWPLAPPAVAATTC